MDALTVRLLPSSVAPGAVNMAADEVLLHSAAQGTASFRMYSWTEPTLSLGYFQSHQERLQHSLLAELPYVRRPSGGQTLVHHREITYALALPPGAAGVRSSIWLQRFHEIIVLALAEFGIGACTAEQAGEDSNNPLCFHHVTRGDILLDNHKITGSAQRRHRGALLQHGAILVERSPFTPTLPGIVDLCRVPLPENEFCKVLIECWQKQMSWRFVSAEWFDSELRKKEELEKEKYGCAKWNARR